MLTWLDRYVSESLAPTGRSIAKMHGIAGLRTDLQFASLNLKEMSDEQGLLDISNRHNFSEEHKIHLRYIIATMNQVRSFVDAEKLCLNPLSIHVDRELQNELGDGAEAPEDESFFMQLINKHKAIYIDFDNTGIDKDENANKAIFITKSNGKIRVTWIGDIVGNSTEEDLPIHFDWDGNSEMLILEGKPEAKKEFDEISLKVFPMLKSYIKVILSYYYLGEGPKWKAMPQVKDKDMAVLASDKKRRNKLRQFSMFRVLRANPALVPQERRCGVSGRKVGVRYSVREFWRNQPYGPGRSLRKKVLVTSHERGPKDADKKLGIHKLESKWES